MANLTINNGEAQYKVDLQPIKDALATKIEAFLEKGKDASTFSKEGMIQAGVKEVCNIGMKAVGLEKQDRNDDPIKIMVGYLIDLGFNALETNGLALVGEKIDAVLPGTVTEAASDAPASVPTQEQAEVAAPAAALSPSEDATQAVAGEGGATNGTLA